MARYSAFLGRRVEVQYRAGDILLPASGTFVADSGRSIFLEQQFEQKGQHKHFRWEIPYQYIVRLEEKPESTPTAEAGANSAARAAVPRTAAALSEEDPKARKFGGVRGEASNEGSCGGASTMLPLRNRPKTA
ncbi:MAG: hypothetical protein ABSH39_01590 [Candidatus Acidiferrum sp.]|jgi:hypothetical protein